jgi:hypothetical protein
MKIVSLFLESFRVANQMSNARNLADINRAAREIDACCGHSPQHDSASTADGEAGVFAGGLAKQA